MSYNKEIMYIIIAIGLFLLASLPVSILQKYLPFLKSNEYKIWYSSSRGAEISIEKVYIDGNKMNKSTYLSTNKTINLKIQYYYSSNNNTLLEKEIVFEPNYYFENKAKSTNLDQFYSEHFYNVYINDLL